MGYLIGILLCLIVVFLWLSFYAGIELYDHIYIGPNGEQVVVIKKNLLFVTLGYMYDDPETILLFDFIISYHSNNIKNFIFYISDNDVINSFKEGDIDLMIERKDKNFFKGRKLS